MIISETTDPPKKSKGSSVSTQFCHQSKNTLVSRKKLRDIEALEAKLFSGEISSPEPEQKEKVATIANIIKHAFNDTCWSLQIRGFIKNFFN